MDGNSKQVFKDIELEKITLGMYLKKSSLLENTILSISHFTEPLHGIIFKTILDLYNVNVEVDPFSVAQENKDIPLKYLIALEDSIATTENIKFYENKLYELWRLRESITLVHEAKQGLIETGDIEQLKKVAEDINNILVAETKKEITKSQKLNEFFNKLENRDGTLKGVSTGYSEFDRMIKGLVEGKLIIIAARPSMGKTAFALNIAKNVAKNELPIVFSYEMPHDDILERIVREITSISSERFDAAGVVFTTEEWHEVINALEWIRQSGLHIVDDTTLKVPDIRRKIQQLQKENPDKRIVAMIDYLQLIPSNGKGNRQEEVSEISRQLKLMALDLKINVIALSQLSRSVEQRQDKRPMLSDLRESGSIEQDADVVAFLYRDDYYDKDSENKNIVEIIIPKNRDGAIGTVNLAFIKEYGKFVNLERRFTHDS